MAVLLFISYLFLLTSAAAVVSSKKLVMMYPLSHSLSRNSELLLFNTSLLLKSTSSRSAARFNNKRQQQRRGAAAVALSPGSDYTMPLSLGGRVEVSVYMDTGSDIVWVPCSSGSNFTCILCEGKTHLSAHHNLSATASPVSCQSRACSDVHSSIPTSDLCAMARCPLESIEMSECDDSCPAFYYAYGDGSFVARLYKDTLQMSSLIIIKNFTFGCAHEALGEPVGVAGFGRGPLSLPAQLHHNQFSYCLTSHSFDSHHVRQPSPLILGRRFGNNSDLAYTPMLENIKRPYYYYVGLEAITVGNKRIPAPENMKRIDRQGDGGMVVDSGTTYTMLPPQLYNSVVSQFLNTFKRAASVEDRTGLSPCYYLPPKPNKVVIPQLVLHFVGNTSVAMPSRNYFYQFTDHHHQNKAVGCMMLMNAGFFPDSDGPGPAGLLGNYQQQGLEVVYDLLNKRIGFANRKCASLWETLQH
uniref:probable aspartyl protease At4g16563 n=1 Tax=Erigeron canadensis TaxID=72917 RepID=UPI001CB8D3D5|nr:probable aspartyl protease At4g16563 [Erigeron canadensis]